MALALALAIPFKGRRIGIRDLYEMLRDTGLSVIDLFMIGAASGIMIGAINYSGAGFTLSLVLIHVAAGSLILLLIVSAIANIILGAGLPTVGCYILLATLVAPTLIQMGIDPMAAHMFILYYGCLSLISPPVAVAAFVAANLAGADPNRTGWVAMAFGWTIFVIPFLFVYSGTLLLKGDPIFIAHRLRYGGGRHVVHFRGRDGLFAAADRAARPRALRSGRNLPAAAGGSLRRRPLVQHRRGHHGRRAACAGADAAADRNPDTGSCRTGRSASHGAGAGHAARFHRDRSRHARPHARARHRRGRVARFLSQIFNSDLRCSLARKFEKIPMMYP